MPDQPTGSDMGGAFQAVSEQAAERTLSERVAVLLRVLRAGQAQLSSALSQQDVLSLSLSEQAVSLRVLIDEHVASSLSLSEQAVSLRVLIDEHVASLQALSEEAATWRTLRERAETLRALSEETATAQVRSAELAELKWEAQQAELRMLVLTKRAAELERLGTELVARELDGQDDANAAASVPVSIYLANEGIHEQVETAVEQWLATADLSINTRGEPVIGSWFRLLAASLKKAAKTPAAREALLTATHVADSHLTQAQDAYVTATLLQNVGPVLQALQPTKDAVVRAGALLIVKVDWVVQVYQLTAAQQAILDHRPHLAASPKEIITALESPEPVSQDTALQPAQQRGTGTAVS
jgi:hypothetical protein